MTAVSRVSCITTAKYMRIRTFSVKVNRPQYVFPLNITIINRAWDSGTGGYVYWTSNRVPNPTPTASSTRPNYTGTLSGHTVEAETVQVR